MESVQVTDKREIEAVKAGSIEGDVYQDGEVWAASQSLAEWRSQSITLDTSITS